MRQNVYILILFSLVALQGFNQEICNNALDDDNDGYIDLNDDDCLCSNNLNVLTQPTSIIPNPSFEDYSCLPSGYTELNCANDWMQASIGTSDYFNVNSNTNGVWFQGLPPDGDCFAGFAIYYIAGSVNNEYIGTCLNQPLLANETYALSLDIGFELGTVYASDPFDLTFFANPSCNALPYTVNPPLLYDCPVSAPGWDELGSINVEGDFEWVNFTFTFTPSQDYESIVIGGPCASNFTGGAVSYYFIDNLVLNTVTAIDTLLIDSLNLSCDNYILHANIPNYPIQWYKNGIALLGETNDTLELQNDISGNYVATLISDSACLISDTLLILTPQSTLIEIDNFNIYCNNYLLILDHDNEEIQWFHDGIALIGENNDSLFLQGGNIAGSYSVQFTNSSCLISDTILIFPSMPIITEIDSIKISCNNFLLILDDENAEIQWFKDGAALVGENNDSLYLQGNNITGNYSAQLMSDSTCLVSDTIFIVPSLPTITEIDSFKISCNNYLLILDDENDEIQWFQDGIALVGENKDSLFLQGNSIAGNYYAQFISDSTCLVSDTILIDTNYTEILNIEAEYISCNSYLLHINAFDQDIQWKFNGNLIDEAFNDTLIVSDNFEGTYSIEFLNSYCYTSHEIYLSNNSIPEVSIAEGSLIEAYKNDLVALNLNTTIEDYTINWIPFIGLSCLNCLNPTFTANENIVYEVEIIDNQTLCSYKSQIEVKILNKCKIYIPNLFSPNADGVNDNFEIFINQCSVQKIDFSIFNRFGERVNNFSNTEITQDKILWNGMYNGKILNTDVFYYVLQINYLNGEVENYKGNVTLLK